jgi:predicted ferric reductase
MSTESFSPHLPGDLAGRMPRRHNRHRRSAPAPRPRAAWALTVLAGLGLGAVLGSAALAESSGSLQAPGGLLTAAGRLTGLVGTYGMLLMVVLVARLPVLESTFGQDRLIRAHRVLAPWPLGLILVHAVLTTLGYAQASQNGAAHQLLVLLESYSGILAAVVAFGLLTAAAVTSIRAAKRRMRHETWWAVHLYTYLGLGLAVSHQLATGASFVAHPVTRAAWIALWAMTAGAVLVYRVLLPLWRTFRHDLTVVGVQHHGPDAVSLIVSGRKLHKLAVSGGQFFCWRIMARGWWWIAHPYSLSAMPADGRLRVTIKGLGDHSAAMRAIPKGTRIAVEGPYGVFTRHAMRTRKAALIGAGVGITPIRALLEDLPAGVDTVTLVRAPDHQSVLLADELHALNARRGRRLLGWIGPRQHWPMTPRTLSEAIPDLASRDLFVCGPDGFMQAVLDAARLIGVPEEQIHHERFAF